MGPVLVRGNDNVLASAINALNTPWINVKAGPYNAVGDGVHDDTAAIQAAVTAGGDGATLLFPPGTYLVTSTIQVNYAGVHFMGGGRDQSGITYTGTGACIQLDTDDGNGWDAAEYNGLGEGFHYSGMFLTYTGSYTALANGLGAGYGSGTYAIRDWRGGSIRIERALLKSWDYWFWGVQSDINFFQDLRVDLCHSGCYLGPRSDQARIDQIWTIHNDTTWAFEGSRDAFITHWISDGDGSNSTNPVTIRNFTDGRTCENIVFDSPWLEQLSGGGSGITVEAFFDVGSGATDSALNGVLVVRNPFVVVNYYGTAGHQRTNYLIRADTTRSVVVQGISGAGSVTIPWTNLRAVFEIVNDGASTTVPTCYFSEQQGIAGRLIENYSATAVTVYEQVQAGTTYTVNVVGGTGAVTQTTGPITNPGDISTTTLELSGKLTLKNAADALYNAIDIWAGATADQSEYIRFLNHSGTAQWSVLRSAGGDFRITDEVNSVIVFDANAAGTTIVKGQTTVSIRASGTSAVQLNVTSAGTGGTNFGDGAGNVVAAVNSSGKPAFLLGTAIPAGGTSGTGIALSSATNFGVFFGSGAPTLSAAQGSLYLRSDGTTTNDRAYINTNGTTGWTALTTAS